MELKGGKKDTLHAIDWILSIFAGHQSVHSADQYSQCMREAL